MTSGNHTYKVEGIPYDNVQHARVVARRFAERYNKAITIRCTFTDNELITHHEVEYMTIDKHDKILSRGELFK